MITFVATHPHTRTVAALRGEVLGPLMPPTRAITYDALFAARRLRPGTYVFTDQERLHPAELRLAARFHRTLAAMPGFRALNDSARVKTRYALLRALAEAGLNDFDAYCADGLPRPKRFPVFLRIASDHAGPIGDLIHDQAELDRRLAAFQADGIPLAGVLAVEFCAEPDANGLYEKFSVLKIGDRLTLSAVFLGATWSVKVPVMGLDNPEVARDHTEAIRTDRHAEALRAAFDIAAIDYGRADVGLCNGRLQVYEINTNPNITASSRYASEAHRDSRQTFRARFAAMLHEIDLPAQGRAVRLDLGRLDKPSHRRRQTAKATHAVLRIKRAWSARAARRRVTPEAGQDTAPEAT